MTPLKVSLPIEGPYRLGQTLSLLRLGGADPSLRIDAYRGQMALATPAGGVAIAAVQEPGAGRLHLLVQGAGAEWIEPHLAGLFGLEDDPSGFAPSGQLDRLAREHYGQRLPKLPCLFGRLTSIVLQQLISFNDACHGWRRLVRRYGEEVPGSEGLYVPPPSDRVAELADYELMDCHILPKHARIILRLAKQAASIERLWGAGVDPAARDRLCEWLLGQPGIGPWTVGNLRGVGLGDADAVVLHDFGLPHAVAYFFTGRERSDDEEMLRLLEPYRPHRFRVTAMLMHSHAKPPRKGPKRESIRGRFSGT